MWDGIIKGHLEKRLVVNTRDRERGGVVVTTSASDAGGTGSIPVPAVVI